MADERQTYKILRAGELAIFATTGRFDGSNDDLRDGFVHLSTKDQLSGTLTKHFAGEASIFVAQCPISRLGEALTWEISRGGQLFPHLYRALTRDDVSMILPVPDQRENWAPPTWPDME
ncbi:DUF952 domain-containing protein [Acuticoccus sp. M5D2P5]|uniref:DUF952 domain-containing protein n=1 Tax=Acuticoccus kalidii TaxID=2910977 RepID=UPI001F34D6D7|nr:DUF952 domain-containing protein [Acuticoccus kalidii]MCF3933651.1 DUF952 domain-containing protein [Acuticoccus kalidii]